MDLSNVKNLAQKAMELGAPQEEAFVLAINRAQCQECEEWEYRGGLCSTIRNHKDKMDFEKFTCNDFRRRKRI